MINVYKTGQLSQKTCKKNENKNNFFSNFFKSVNQLSFFSTESQFVRSLDLLSKVYDLLRLFIFFSESLFGQLVSATISYLPFSSDFFISIDLSSTFFSSCPSYLFFSDQSFFQWSDQDSE
eukprot:TRINITY_DN634_c0_g3_i5.p2 TRINITY_DN634_c0_g3~~TRINITY_DN634_c0_g3_i5.p2  ORF type:complete len:121 (-),score=19.51 TRINITY_DN634_c0_g3_i5:361-723(-)